MKRNNPGNKSQKNSERNCLTRSSGPEPIIRRAEALLKAGNYALSVAKIDEATSFLPFDDPLLTGRLLRVRAFAEVHSGRLSVAEDAAVLGQLMFPEVLDFPFALCSVKLAIKDYAGARLAGERFLKLREQKRGTAIALKQLNAAGGQVAEVFLWIGIACKQSGATKDARSYLNEAIKADSKAPTPYVELATMLRSMGQDAEARSIIDQGRSACRTSTELRLLAESFKAGPTISACMIVKDEEELLPGCLDSIRDWVDEIVVVDTGSADRTVAIARSYGAQVFHQQWEGDFSKHRNYSLDQATSDWILIIDADERMVEEDFPAVRRLLENPQYSAIAISVFNVYENKHAETFLPSIRFFRRSLNLRYDGIVHNTLVYPADLPIARANVSLKHLGYGLSEEKMRLKLNRTKELLRKQLAENPHHGFAWFNLAQALRGEAAAFDADTTNEVIEAATKAVALTSADDAATRHIHLMALDQLAWAHFGQGSYTQAAGFAQRALSTKPNYLDPLLLLGHVHARQQHYVDAEQAYRKYLEVQATYNSAQEVDNIILLHLDSRATAYFALGTIAEIQSDSCRAIKHYHETIALNPNHLDVHERLARLALGEGDLTEAEASYSTHLTYHPEATDSRLGLAYIKWSKGDQVSAERLYLEVLDLQPENWTALSKLSRLYLQFGHGKKLEAMLGQAVQLAERCNQHEQELASLMFACGRWGEAADWYAKAIEKDPRDAALHNDLGNCYFKQSQFEEAERQYRKSLEQGDIQPIAWRNLALVQARNGNYPAAADSLEEFVAKQSDAAENLLLLADIYFQGANYGAAIKTYERYLLANPKDVRALFGLAETYLAMGHRDSAALGYRRVLAIDPDFDPANRRIRELEKSGAAY